MKLPRRKFLHLAAGAAALLLGRKLIRRGRSGSWFHFHRAARSTPLPGHGWNRSNRCSAR